MDSVYNEYFFNEFYEEQGGGNYIHGDEWKPFFAGIADRIITIFSPKTVLDAGCACGYLVEALRTKGVDAYGIDISEYAISQVNPEIASYCMVSGIEDALPDTFPSKYDLIFTIEVLEHLYPEVGIRAIANLCTLSDRIIFSSTPSDIVDPTHVNVQQPEYWCRLFAQNSFYRNLIQPLDFISPWTMFFEKKSIVSDVIDSYERILRICKAECNMQANDFQKKVKEQQKIIDENQHIIRSLEEKVIHVGEIKKKNQHLECNLFKTKKEYEDSKKLLNELEDKNVLMLSKLKDLQEDNNILSEKIKQIYIRKADLELENEDLRVAYMQLKNSTCWKITKPLRFIGKKLGR